MPSLHDPGAVSPLLLLLGTNPNLFGFVFAKREMVAAHPDFYRITQGRESNQFEPGSCEQTHLQ